MWGLAVCEETCTGQVTVHVHYRLPGIYPQLACMEASKQVMRRRAREVRSLLSQRTNTLGKFPNQTEVRSTTQRWQHPMKYACWTNGPSCARIPAVETGTLVAIVIALLALTVATPSFVQRIWGGPRITLGFEAEEQGMNRVLLGQILNAPVRNRFARFVGVRRESAGDVVARFRIRESDSGTVIVPAVMAEIATHRDTKAERVTLPSSSIPSTFDIARWLATDNRAEVVARDPQIIGRGQYTVEVVVSFSGKTVRANRHFIVGLARVDLEWV